jgi:HK97 gp10 family phage protein
MARYVAGLAELNRKIAALPPRARQTMQDALVISGEEMAATARALVPVDSGALRDSIVSSGVGGATPLFASGGRRPAHDLQVIITAGNYFVRYAPQVEFGTSDTPRRPFFFPAFRSIRRRLLRRITRSIGAAARGQAASEGGVL